MRNDLDKRTKALEARHHVDQADEETVKLRLFLEKLTDEELERGLAIAERTGDYVFPLTVEEQKFLDDLEAKYSKR